MPAHLDPDFREERDMFTTHRILWAAAVFLVVLARAVLTAQTPAKTVWDGAYTDAQAERAQGTFSANCSRCHTLTTEGARPLVGTQFWQANTQKSVGDLLKFVSTNMPNGIGAGSLSPSAYNDLVALILKSNGFPAGTFEVAPDTVANIQIIPKDGPGELPANTLARVVGCLAPKAGGDWTITNATAPQRIEKPGAAADDATKDLGDRTVTLKFVLSRLDANVGKRVSVSGILIGAGGADGINVSMVSKVGDSCP
jgi:mono/diheme cytochrome c family protein